MTYSDLQTRIIQIAHTSANENSAPRSPRNLQLASVVPQEVVVPKKRGFPPQVRESQYIFAPHPMHFANAMPR